MKKVSTLTISVLASLLTIACTQKLPSYQDFHGNSSTGNNSPETEKPEEEQPGSDIPQTELFYIDQELIKEFESTVELGSEGEIRIFKKDGTEVDKIMMSDVAAIPSQMKNDTPYNTTIDFLGPKSLKRWRAVNYKPVTTDGNKLIIRPHSGKLEYNTSYYITIDANAIKVQDFKGIKASEWEFTTKSEPASKSEVTVSKTGDADFRTIQAAIDWAYICGPTTPMVINIKNGIYEEQLFARQNNKITFKGESRDGVILQYRNAEVLANGTGGSTGATPVVGTSIGKSGGRAVILFENCDDIRFENMTMKNTYGMPGQAEVIYNNDNNGQYNIAFINCSLHSLQDTFNTKGYCWMYNCLIEGDCDFIWGSPKTCLIEKCQINSVGDGYIVQARCPDATDKGFIFLECKLTKPESVSSEIMYLARSGGSSDYYDNVAYINCTMSNIIKSVGWLSNPIPNPAKASATSGWKEYGSKDINGKAIDMSKRNSAAYQLTEAEYEAEYKDRSKIFKGAPVGTEWLTY